MSRRTVEESLIWSANMNAGAPWTTADYCLGFLGPRTPGHGRSTLKGIVLGVTGSESSGRATELVAGIAVFGPRSEAAFRTKSFTAAACRC
jgi:hypothetical protein